MIKMKLSVLVCLVILLSSFAEASKFWDDFYVIYGQSDVKFPGRNPGETVNLSLTRQTGSGFRSNLPYMFGKVSMKIKLVGGNSAGTVTSYYMASVFKQWSELDFEFLGNLSGKPYILQTNVFVEGKGDREQRINLWFDPTADYHEYGLLWNQNLVLFLVDNRVIRVFHNMKDHGVPYLDYQPMFVYSTIWDGSSWATRGGRDKINWSQQPFRPSYTAFNVSNACSVRDNSYKGIHQCYTKLYQSSYGRAPNLALTNTQINDLRWIKRTYVMYDYCTDKERFSGMTPPECAKNWP